MVDRSLPTIVEVRARVLASETGAGFPFGFSVFTGQEAAGFQLNPDTINVSGTFASLDNSDFHDYRLHVTPGADMALFVDDVLLGSKGMVPNTSSNGLAFGDPSTSENGSRGWLRSTRRSPRSCAHLLPGLRIRRVR